MNIRLKTILLLSLLLLSLSMKADNIRYGLSFKAHNYPATERTSLSLDDGRAFSVQNVLTLSFQMQVREGESIFGSILHLITDDGQSIHLANVIDEGKCMPAFVFNDGMQTSPAKIILEKWQAITLKIDAKKNHITLNYGGSESSYTIPLNGTKGLKLLFGKGDAKYVSDVAPILVKDIKVYEGNQLVRYWKLARHNAETCLDEVHNKPATAAHPLWILDNHVEWRTIFHQKLKGILGVTYNPNAMQFYLCNNANILTLNKQGRIIKQQKVLSGYKANTKSNGFLAYDCRDNQLMSFSLQSGAVSYFSFEQSRWSRSQKDNSLALYYNHSGAYNATDSSYYFFGGYGYYRYHNKLFRIRVGSSQVESIPYSGSIPPRFGAAMGVANGKLYLFGGRGNKQGKQAVESYYYYELWSIDLKTHKAKLEWKRNSMPKGGIMATTMFYQPEKKAFYALNMVDQGGTMYQVNIGDTIITPVAKPIANNTQYQEFEYNMFNSPKDGHMYLVVDKILVDKTHDLSIYQLCTPLLSEAETSQTSSFDKYSKIIYIAGGILALIAVVASTLVLMRKKRKVKSVNYQKEDEATITPAIQTSTNNTSLNVETGNDLDEEEKQEQAQHELIKYFDRAKAAVSLLGQFSVFDKDGNNITEQFTPRLKELLLLLILYSDKKKHGVSVEKITEIIWFDKKEASARNNRNVTLRKLRILLESVGDIEIISSNGYLSIKWGKNVFCDYHTMMDYLKAYNEGEPLESDEELDRILEILLYGPLLQGYETDWLDDFKDNYSSFSLDLLNKLLRQKVAEGNDCMVLCIADIMFLHDPLNEEALEIKCQILARQGKMGLAKRSYERFCKVYQESMAEEYDKSFPSIVK